MSINLSALANHIQCGTFLPRTASSPLRMWLHEHPPWAPGHSSCDGRPIHPVRLDETRVTQVTQANHVAGVAMASVTSGNELLPPEELSVWRKIPSLLSVADRRRPPWGECGRATSTSLVVPLEIQRTARPSRRLDESGTANPHREVEGSAEVGELALPRVLGSVVTVRRRGPVSTRSPARSTGAPN